MSEIIKNLDSDIKNVNSFAEEVENKSHEVVHLFL